MKLKNFTTQLLLFLLLTVGVNSFCNAQENWFVHKAKIFMNYSCKVNATFFSNFASKCSNSVLFPLFFDEDFDEELYDKKIKEIDQVLGDMERKESSKGCEIKALKGENYEVDVRERLKPWRYIEKLNPLIYIDINKKIDRINSIGKKLHERDVREDDADRLRKQNASIKHG
jgi:hypothetical protein